MGVREGGDLIHDTPVGIWFLEEGESTNIFDQQGTACRFFCYEIAGYAKWTLFMAHKNHKMHS